MPGAVIAAIVVAAAVALAAAVWMIARNGATRTATSLPPSRPAPPVADFHVHDGTATVSFEVPLPAGEVDEVLGRLLVVQAVEVLRDKRHHLPLDAVTRIVARGRRDAEWVEAGSLSLETPGVLPRLEPPVLIPGLHSGRDLDLLVHANALPEHAPGLAAATDGDTLAPLAAELRLPAAISAGLRSQGIDPTAADAGDLVIGILRLTGATVTETAPGTYRAVVGGRPTLIRVVPHRPGEHPELGDAEIRRFAADAASSRTDGALLITEKYSPFQVYERERRDPRTRYVTRERVQHFIDSLALG